MKLSNQNICNLRGCQMPLCGGGVQIISGGCKSFLGGANHFWGCAHSFEALAIEGSPFL